MAKNNTTTPETPDSFTKVIQDKLMSQSNVISSSSSNIESAINKAIGGVEKATEAESKRIESSFGRQAEYGVEKAKANFQDFSESRSGFGTQMAAFRNLVQTTDKEMKDLAMRKEEMLLANNSAGYSKIADLELKSLEFKQKAAQDVFTNLIQAGSYGLQAHAEDRAGKEFTANLNLNKERLALDKDNALKDQQAKMADIAAEYGVTLSPTDTLADVVAKVGPMASSIKKAELNRLLAETAKINNDFEKNKTLANFQSRIAQLLSTGKTPSEAALQAMAEGKAIGLDMTPEMFNNAQDSADKMSKEMADMASKTVADTAPTYWNSVFKGIAADDSFGGISTLAARTVTSPKSAFDSWKNLVGF